ncbi:Thiopurine S-methyltransferase [Schizopora paradoxa]|uniref:Thiopurine S-methyltransferase n=1 Tax=Schizopora paradoxa TaxID=27342 RepID=A0A0H2RTN7_9AGAM|nr:Thiopurine S-methyltransferase [Schizopora paradoxa]
MDTKQENISSVDKNEKILALRRLISESGASGWDRAWEESVTPWDNGNVQKALIEALDSTALTLPANGRALVPGCGRGYDAVYIASKLSYTTIGLDLSPKAVNAAKLYADSIQIEKESQLEVSFHSGDFFTYKVDEQFDLVYDYTFFCAIPLELREGWGKQMCDLIKTGGHLITLAYPIDGDRKGGPPFSVDIPSYAAVLGSGWEKILDKVPDEVTGNSVGRVRLVIWKKL